MIRIVLGAASLVLVAVNAVPGLQDQVEGKADGPVAMLNEARAAKTEPEPERYGRLRVKADRAGHYHMTAVIKGRRIEVVADTGATVLALSHEDAQRLGLRPARKDFTVKVRTANGETRAAPVMLREVRIGSIRVRNVQAIVSQPGAMSTNLLGMSFLGQLSKFSVSDGELIMVQ